MTNNLLILALWLGLDSFVVGLGIGPALTQRQRWRLAGVFGVCDGAASWLGWAAGAPAWGGGGGLPAWCDWLGPIAVAGYGAYVLGLAWRGRQIADRGELATRGLLALALPLCLSLDNLATGTGSGGSWSGAVLAALGFALVSGTLAVSGMSLGDALARRLRPRADWLAGSALVIVAAAMALKEVWF